MHSITFDLTYVVKVMVDKARLITRSERYETQLLPKSTQRSRSWDVSKISLEYGLCLFLPLDKCRSPRFPSNQNLLAVDAANGHVKAKEAMN